MNQTRRVLAVFLVILENFLMMMALVRDVPLIKFRSYPLHLLVITAVLVIKPMPTGMDVYHVPLVSLTMRREVAARTAHLEPFLPTLVLLFVLTALAVLKPMQLEQLASSADLELSLQMDLNVKLVLQMRFLFFLVLASAINAVKVMKLTPTDVSAEPATLGHSLMANRLADFVLLEL